MNPKIVEVVKNGGLVILPTDTLYGVHASAFNRSAVEKAYQIMNRTPTKPFIILLSSIDQLKLFNIFPSFFAKEILGKYWPGKVSVALPCHNLDLTYLHRGTNSLAFRLPDKEDLTDLINQTGPLISTSANPEGQKPATTIRQAKAYFGKQIDYYEDQGELNSRSSTLIAIQNKQIVVLRQGEVIIRNE